MAFCINLRASMEFKVGKLLIWKRNEQEECETKKTLDG